MDQVQRSCALCDGPIEAGEAWMTADREASAGAVAHAGCVYAERADEDDHARWAPSDAGADR